MSISLRSARWARIVSTSAVLAAGIISGSGAALATEPTVAAEPAATGGIKAAYFPLAGDAPAKKKKLVLAGIRGAISAVGRHPVLGTARFAKLAERFECDPGEAACSTTIANLLEVQELVRAKLDMAPASTFDEPASGKKKRKKKGPADLRLSLKIANARGRVLLSESLLLPGRRLGPGSVRAAVRPVLERAAERSHGTLLVKSNPAGANVVIDGVARGTTPLEVTLMVGGHTLDLIYGAEEKSRSVDVTAKGGELIVDLTAGESDVELDDDPLGDDDDGGLLDGDDPPPPRAIDDDRGAKDRKFELDPKRLRMPALVTLGSGAGLLVLGLVLGGATLGTWAAYRSRTNDLVRPLTANDLGELRDLHRMGKRGKALAITSDTMLILGGLSAIGGGILGYLDMREPRAKTSATIAPLSGGVGLVVEGEW